MTTIPNAVKAAIAGARGRHAQPLTLLARTANYDRQNGHPEGTRRLTPKQTRRALHKDNKAIRRDQVGRA